MPSSLSRTHIAKGPVIIYGEGGREKTWGGQGYFRVVRLGGGGFFFIKEIGGHPF